MARNYANILISFLPYKIKMKGPEGPFIGLKYQGKYLPEY